MAMLPPLNPAPRNPRGIAFEANTNTESAGHDQPWAEQFGTHLAEARDLGQLRPEVDEAAFAQVIVAAYTGTQIMSRLSSARGDLPDRDDDAGRI